MRRYISYISYVLRHKFYVLLACWRHGLFWQGIVHDLSKFSPSEFFAYANYHYNADGSKRKVRKNGYYRPEDAIDTDFGEAWLHHMHSNKHHWQFWIIPGDDGKLHFKEIPLKYLEEMICDWEGVSRALGLGNSPWPWFQKHEHKILMHPNSKTLLKLKLIEWFSIPCKNCDKSLELRGIQFYCECGKIYSLNMEDIQDKGGE